MEFDINKISFDEIPSQIVEIWEKLAEYTATYDTLDKMEDVILASLCNKCPIYLDDKWKRLSMAERTNYAIQQPEYKNHIEQTWVAREQMLKYRAYMQALEARHEYFRSMNSKAKAEMRMN